MPPCTCQPSGTSIENAPSAESVYRTQLSPPDDPWEVLAVIDGLVAMALHPHASEMATPRVANSFEVIARSSREVLAPVNTQKLITNPALMRRLFWWLLLPLSKVVSR